MMLRLMPYSLRARLTALIVLSASAVLILSGLAVYSALKARIIADATSEMTDTLAALEVHLGALTTAAAIAPNEATWEDHLHGRQHMALAIFDLTGTRLLDTAGFRDYAPIHHVQSVYHPVDLAATGTGLRYLVAIVPFEGQVGKGVRVVVQYDLTNDRAVLRADARTIFAIEAIGIVLAAVLAYGVATIGLSPLRRLLAQADAMSTNQLAQRLPELGGAGELQELGQAFNGMLGRLDDSFTRLSEFSSNLAHDLRTPLTNLQTAAQVALAQPRTTQAYREVIESSVDEYQRLSRMIDDMLFLARAERVEMSLSIREFDAAREAGRIAGYYDSLAQDSDIAIEVRGQGRVYANLLLFQRAVSNLLANALAHAPRGSVIVIECVEAPDATTVCVSDTGPGIAAPHIERIFDRFYRVDPSRRGHAGSTGLGLAIVKSIMENHRGECGVNSQPNVRTTFWLRFTHPAS
ncbi:MAG TPA: heavy metal sensor histidine kinase [Paraburkholderia sp.]|nr:heavy metal sensor histidine kinase [Paraburkholderia sp.]